MKSILLEINHPAQVHLFRNLYNDLILENKIIVITKKNKSVTDLLNLYSIPYKIIGKKFNNIFLKGLLQIYYNFIALFLVYKNNISIAIGSSITNDHVSLFSGVKSIHFSDDDQDQVPLINYFSYPFADLIVAPSSLNFKLHRKKVIKYNGTHELAYLHPNRFEPNPEVLNMLKLDNSEIFFVIRFVSFQGHHDIGKKGLSFNQKKYLVNLLSKYGKIFITSESPIESEFEKYRITISPELIHSVLYYAQLFVGDSQTMTSEAAILGTPALKCNSFAGKLSVANELEKQYGLCFSYQPTEFDELCAKLNSLLSTNDLKKVWKTKRNKFLKDKIDVTSFFKDLIENY